MPKRKKVRDEQVFSTIAIYPNDVEIFREVSTYVAEELCTKAIKDADRMTAILRYLLMDKMRKEMAHKEAAHKDPEPAIVFESHPPASATKPHSTLRDCVGVDTQKQLAEIRRVNPGVSDVDIYEMAVAAIYYQLEPTVEELDVDCQIDHILARYDVTEAQLMSIGIDQLHYDWSAAQGD